jgi:hypothetical protein
VAVAARHGQVSKHSHPAEVCFFRRRADGVLRLQVMDSAGMQHVWLPSLPDYRLAGAAVHASVLHAARAPANKAKKLWERE